VEETVQAVLWIVPHVRTKKIKIKKIKKSNYKSIKYSLSFVIFLLKTVLIFYL
jgi:hypothetical protein